MTRWYSPRRDGANVRDLEFYVYVTTYKYKKNSMYALTEFKNKVQKIKFKNNLL